MTLKKVFSFLGTSFTEGDVLEVTVKGKARLGDSENWLALDASDRGAKGKGNLILLSGEGVTSVSRVEPPLAVGDLVRAKSARHGSIGRLICVFDFGGVPWAAVHFVDSAPGTAPLADYVRAE